MHKFNKCNSLNTYFQHVHGIEIMLVCIHYRYSCGCFSLDVQLYVYSFYCSHFPFDTPVFLDGTNYGMTLCIRPSTVYTIQYIPRNMHTVFALLCFVVVIHWLIFPYPSGLLHWHCGNLTIVPVPAKQTWWIWINTSCEFIMNDCVTPTKQSTTKLCAYFLGYTVTRNTFPNHFIDGQRV